MNLLIWLGNTLILIQPFAKTLAPFLAGFALFAATQSEQKQGIWLRLGLLSLFISVGTFCAFNGLIQPKFAGQVPAFPKYDLFLSALFFAGGLASYFVWLREGHPWWNSRAQKLTKTTVAERNKKTDIRTIVEHLPKPINKYDPRQYFDLKKGLFFGLDEYEKPVYWVGDLNKFPHVEVVGGSGLGKGIFVTNLVTQFLLRDEAIFNFDVKNDEFATHVLGEFAKKHGKKFFLVDLNKDEPQINLSKDCDFNEAQGLMYSGFEINDGGDAGVNFYLGHARKVADQIAKQVLPNCTFASLLNANKDLKTKENDGFFNKLESIASVKSVNAKIGLDLQKIMDEGGMVYIVGDSENEKIIMAQKMLLIRIVQIAKKRDRVEGKPRSVCVILDEFANMITKPSVQVIRQGRDKSIHVILAHQAMQDLRDVPGYLNAESVEGAVFASTPLKIVYKVEDEETKLKLAKKSGNIQVDDEVRRASKNAALAEIIGDERQIRQAQTYYMDENKLESLYPGLAVIFGMGLPRFIHVSHQEVKKNQEYLKTQVFEGDSIIQAADLI